MTEREKRIEEMVEIIDDAVRSTTHHSINLIDVTCRILEEAGYRKADEVRKEVANRFLGVINNLLDDVEKGSIKTLEELQLQLIYNVHFLRKEFGAEVEE